MFAVVQLNGTDRSCRYNHFEINFAAKERTALGIQEKCLQRNSAAGKQGKGGTRVGQYFLHAYDTAGAQCRASQ